MAKKKKDKQAKALEAIEKAIRKAAGKGVAAAAIQDTVEKAVAAAGTPKAAAAETKPAADKPKKAAKKAKKAAKKVAKSKKQEGAVESA